ncbi:restriction endonuclease [Rhizobium sp. CFBP 13726]|uniref:restriction endonuclease n=1 Tax=Rhizobium sp. CFBP 13726 TaxID=2775296 RepID=UPI00177E2523|nr:restriction endonuclease [Rhizobium sp. CFBP 13726]MBD8651006.1 restriction endonuclease [Rhizobium sp. CFBP 13726]
MSPDEALRGYLFEQLVDQLLESMGYNVSKESRTLGAGRMGVLRPDFIARRVDDQSDLLLCGEARWTHRPDIRLKQLRDWAAAVARYKDDVSKVVLIVSGDVDPARLEWAQEEFSIEIWDRSFILAETSGTPLHDEFKNLFEAAGSVKLILQAGEVGGSPPISARERSAVEQPAVSRAEELIRLLDDIVGGRDGAKRYELLCEEIINYIFGHELTDVKRQPRLEDDLSILDLTYRVRSKSPFWSALARDFRARVIVFECKNYTDPIGAMQVFTTERYLSVDALRPVCFLLCRKLPADHAIAAAQGAMRENGKLIIFLDDEKLKAMLRLKDAQIADPDDSSRENDPSEALDQIIYDFLATMPR